MSNEYLLTFTEVDDVATVTINDEVFRIGILPKGNNPYKRDISDLVKRGINTLRIVCENRTRYAACAGSLTKNGVTIHSWVVQLQDYNTGGEAPAGPFLDETLKFVDQ